MSTLHEIARSAPHTPGVYIFRRGRTPIYIGKAADLKKRLTSYFRDNTSDKVRRLRTDATALEWIELESEIEALIREADLIKRHSPKYNVLMRDDKSYFYVAFTKEEFPRVFAVHKTNLDKAKYRQVIGPFTSGSALRSALKILRRIFPYCTCTMPHKRLCLNAQIGRCPGFCCTGVPTPGQKEQYADTVKNISAVLSGKRKQLLTQLKSAMRAAVKNQEFERATELRDQAASMENIFGHRQTLEYTGLRRRIHSLWHTMENEIQTLLQTHKKISRVEGYDISNISGTAATGSMVVFENGRLAKSKYRKFKIKTVRGANDVASHREVMRRRLTHPEWGMPDLILIDGGKPQLAAVRNVLRPGNDTIFLAALAKREEELYIEGGDAPVRLDSLSQDTMHFFQRIRDESHRFAKKYHHKLREISYRENLKNQN